MNDDGSMVFLTPIGAVAGAIGLAVSSGNAPAPVSGAAVGVLTVSLITLVWSEVRGRGVRPPAGPARMEPDDEDR